MKHHRITAAVCLSLLLAPSGARAEQAPSTKAPAPAPAPGAQGKAPAPALRTAESAITPKAFQKGRHESFMKRKEEGPIGLLFLGDSITDHWPRSGAETWAKFAPHNPADFGVSRIRTEGLLWNITNGELDGIRPKAVVLMIGINNILQCPDEEPEWVAAAITKMVGIVHEKIPGTTVIVMGILPGRWGHVKAQPKIEAVNRILARLDNGKTTRFLDIGAAFLTPGGDVNRELLPDRLHPNEKGYAIWYNALQPILAGALK
jgi:beta-glucosidase